MEARVIEKIALINQEFYQKFAHSFSSTRNTIQPGAARLLANMPDGLKWLDVGCGNGTLALAWLEQRRSGYYLGCDFSLDLLNDARIRTTGRGIPPGLSLDFLCLDINQDGWWHSLPRIRWDVISLFAVLHHIPCSQNRLSLCSQLRQLVEPGRQVCVSVWQLQNSSRLLPRIKPWQMVGISNQAVEQGDVLMDWRAGIDKGEEINALRYVHIFSESDLTALAESAGFRVMDSFYSDGKEKNLALYQNWI